jgi:hypothetical protein
MLKNKELTNIIELYYDLTAYRQAFENVVLMVQGAMIISVTSATCERSFSEMQIMKTALRNTMGNARLNDLEEAVFRPEILRFFR